MKPHQSTIDRLAAARPDVDRAVSAISIAERSRLLRDVIESGDRRALAGGAGRLLAAAGAASAAATLALGVVDIGETPSPPASEIDRAAPRVVVLDQVRLAMSASSSHVVHLRSDPGTGVLWESWHDEATGRSRSVSTNPDGTPIYDHEFTPTHDGLRVKVISYVDRAWWEHTAPTGRGMRVGPTPDEVRAQIADGTLRETGREPGEGGELIRLRSEGTSDVAKLSRPMDLWVDADTYLPVRSVTEQPGSRPPIVTTFEWLPREQQEGALEAAVPGGFAHLERAPESQTEAEAKG